jgi:preprotein translocase subunit SecF
VLISLVPKHAKDKSLENKAGAKTIQDELVSQVKQALPQATVQQVDYIGPQVGQELATKGALAIVIALLGTMIYIGLRFEFRFAVGSTVALIHDPVLILGIFALFHIEFNLIALAAVLTVIGYSLNDTIVIFDRVRENFRKLRKATPVEVINQSTNQTLSRTLMTSMLTLIVVFALFFLGGTMLEGFALALIIGIIVGTYSSIYIAGSLALSLGLTRQHLLPTPKEELDSRP